MRASALVPPAALRTIDRVRTRAFLARTGPATTEYVRRNGLAVTHGPFTGMSYLDGLERTSGDLVAKLTGSYERELHPVIESWVAARPAHVIDVGCAEGYYAVGLALAIPGTHVHAYDIDVQARVRCAELAQQNAVAGRVSVHSECTPATLADFPEQGVVLLSDCEGYELTLLDPALAPRLNRWPILVELHDFLDPSISQTIAERFAPTHEIEVIEGEPRDGDGMPELDFMTPRQRRAVLSERRPGPMRWARMDPRDG